MSLLPIEEAVAAHQNPHLVSVGGSETAGRCSGTAARLSRSVLPFFLLPPSVRGYRCTRSRANMQPPAAVSHSDAGDATTGGRLDRQTDTSKPCQEVCRKQSRLGKKNKT